MPNRRKKTNKKMKGKTGQRRAAALQHPTRSREDIGRMPSSFADPDSNDEDGEEFNFNADGKDIFEEMKSMFTERTLTPQDFVGWMANTGENGIFKPKMDDFVDRTMRRIKTKEIEAEVEKQIEAEAEEDRQIMRDLLHSTDRDSPDVQSIDDVIKLERKVHGDRDLLLSIVEDWSEKDKEVTCTLSNAQIDIVLIDLYFVMSKVLKEKGHDMVLPEFKNPACKKFYLKKITENEKVRNPLSKILLSKLPKFCKRSGNKDLKASYRQAKKEVARDEVLNPYRECSGCSVTKPVSELQKCSQCLSVLYCSRECQGTKLYRCIASSIYCVCCKFKLRLIRIICFIFPFFLACFSSQTLEAPQERM